MKSLDLRMGEISREGKLLSKNMEGTSQFGGMSSQDNDTTLHTNDFEDMFGLAYVSTITSEMRHRISASHSPKEQHLLYKLYQRQPTSPADTPPKQQEVKQ